MPIRSSRSYRIHSYCVARLLLLGVILLTAVRPVLGQTWTQLAPTGGLPSARGGSGSAFDPATNQMILFGGEDSQGADLNDVWSLSLGAPPQWSQLTPLGSRPAGRVGSSTAYDSANARLIMFGGGLGHTSPCVNDVWVLSNANGVGGLPTWTQLTPSGTAPAPRWAATAIYAPASNTMTIFGGNNCFSTTFNEVWVLSNANGLGGTPFWTQLSPAGTAPSASDATSAVYDPGSNRMILYGFPANPDQVWVLTNANGLGGTPTWILLSPSVAGPPKTNQATAYDASSNSLIVFGGLAGNVFTNDTWVLSNANGLGGAPNWTQLNPSGGPPSARCCMATVYDPATKRMVVFGGGNNTSSLNDTWTLSFAPPTPVQILSISPAIGGNTGNVTARIFGNGFQSGATVRLTGVGPDIVGSNTAVTNVINTSVLGTVFDLTGASPGIRDVVVTNPDGTTATDSQAFSVQQGGGPNLTITVIGLDRIRFGNTQTYYGLIQNRGIIDAANVVAFVNQSSPPQSSGLLSLSAPIGVTQPLPSTFIGSVPALSSLIVPFPAQGPISGAPSNCILVNGGLHALQPNDPCAAFEAAKAVAEAYLNSLYGLRLVNLLLLENSIELGICFNPSNLSSSTACDSLESIDSNFDSAIKSAESDESALCAMAAAAGCPLNCNDPSDINTLKVIGDGLKGTIDQLKEIFTLVTVPPAQLGGLKSQVALFETQALALSTSLVFPPQPQPQPPTAIPTDNSSSLGACGVGSLDPNSKIGVLGVGTSQYVKGNLEVPYSLSFGNMPSATAPAQTVTITDVLNPNLDLTSLTLGPISFPNHAVTPPSIPLLASPFITTIDLRPASNLLVQIKVSLDSTTGILTSTFQSLDPATNRPPTDPTVGFLPPGGEGTVFFTVGPRQGLPTNTQIQNLAKITFDVNPPMSTQTWLNTIDNTPPTSQVKTLPATEFSATFPVTWAGTDIGAGVQDFTIYVSDNGGPFTAFQTNTTATSATFIGQNGHTYAFYSIARDLVGNVEAAKTAAEATTLVSVDTIPPTTTVVVSPLSNAAGWNNSNVTVTITSVDNPGGSGVQQITYSGSGAQTIASTVVPGASTSFTVSSEGITTITFFGTDNAGNVESAKTLTIQLDKTPPTIACSVSPNVLWPPDNKLVSVNLSVSVTDALSGSAGFTLVSVTSNEPDSGQGDIQGFVTGTASTTGQLRAQRLGSGSGRVYMFTYNGSDKAGNTASCTTTATVPHDQSNN